MKSRQYYGPIDIAKFFARVGLEESDVHMLTSANERHHKVDALIPEKKVRFFYWFRVDVKNEAGEALMENANNFKKIDERSI